MNEIAKLSEEQEFCTYCGKPIWTDVEWSSGDEPFCKGCFVDREASRIDAAHERRRDGLVD